MGTDKPTDVTPRDLLPRDTLEAKAASETKVPEAEVEGKETPIGVIQPEGKSATTALSSSGIPTGGTANLQVGPVQMRAEGVVGGRPAAGEAIVRGSGLVADPDYRISLSDPRVKSQHTASKAKLEALLERLNAVHGEDAEAGPQANTEQVPLSEDELALLRHTVAAAIELHEVPTLPQHLIEALKNIYEYLVNMQNRLTKLTVSALALNGLIDVLSGTAEALKELLVALGAL